MKHKQFRIRKIEKIMIAIMVISLAISVLPNMDLAMFMSANNPDTVKLELLEGRTSRILSVTSFDPLAAQAVLWKDGKELQRKPLSTQAPAEFVMSLNGAYQIQILDGNENLLGEQTQVIKDFEDLFVEKQGDGSLSIIGRMEATDHITVSFQDTTESLAVQKNDLLYEAVFTPKINGSYVFQSETADGSALGASVSYEETGIPEPEPEQQPEQKEPVKEEPQKQTEQPEGKEIHITNAQGLKDIGKAMDKTYILDNDITITEQGTSSIVQGTFTGTLEGNGHVIKGLKQPLFASMKNAAIYDVVLSSELSGQTIASLSIDAMNSTIKGVGIMAIVHADSTGAGMIVNSVDTTIEDCFVSGKISAGSSASGFVSEGTADITNSYVTGIVEGPQRAYGFGPQASIMNSYAAVYVEGKTAKNFNEEGMKLEGAFYDQSVASIEELRAQGYTSREMVSGELSLKGFQQKQGSYPTLRKDITNKYSEEAKKRSALSTLAISSETSILGIEENTVLPAKTQEEAVSWETTGKVGVSGDHMVAKISSDPNKDTSGELVARTASGTRYLKAASAKALPSSPIAGESVAEEKTHISFNIIERTYYKVATTAQTKPASHKEAIESGWKRYLWSDVINWPELDWDTDYILNEYDMEADLMKTYAIRTNKGKAGGSIALSDTAAVDTEITATLKDALCDKGSWTWERSKSLSSGWTAVKTAVDTNRKTSSYTPVSDDSGYYVRAVFTVSDDQRFEGSVNKAGTSVIKEQLIGIKLYTDSAYTKEATAADMVVGTRLYAGLKQTKFKDDVDYTWHHKTADGSDDDGHINGHEDSYVLNGRDVGMLVYVKAEAKSNSRVSGSVKAGSSTKVIKAAHTAPAEKPEIVKKDDISITVKLPDSVEEGLYQFGYKKAGESAVTPFALQVRGHGELTITDLMPYTGYSIYVKRIGENGFDDSPWSSVFTDVLTEFKYVSGTVDITISNDTYAYGETLKAEVKGGADGQAGEWNWYRIHTDGTRSPSLSSTDTYKIQSADDIGKKIEAVYSGDTTKYYAGRLQAQSETIKKAEVNVPSKNVDSASITATDSTISFQLPAQDAAGAILSNSEKFIVGYATSENGMPIEYSEDDTVKTYAPSSSVTLKGLNRDTTYYVYLRYAQTDIHNRSDWSAVGTRFEKKTEKTALSGTLSFTYAGTTAVNPVQGEKLKAVLDASNTKEGTWTWAKIQGGVETKIVNFFPEEAGTTYYMIPSDEAVGTTYKVTFTPETGYSGSRTQTSAALLEYKQEKYDAPLVAPKKTSQTDTTLTIQMGTDAMEGIVYEFQYGAVNDATNTGNKIVTTKAYKGADVTISGLDRNTTYYIWVRRAKDNDKDASAWGNANLTVKTEQTAIQGYVSIAGIDTAGDELTATYNKAKYNPSGDDGNGTWKWYRENGGSYTQIMTGITSNKTESRYTPTSADIGKKLKAEYTGSGDFKESKEASTSAIHKQLAKDPVITITRGSDTADDHLSINAILDETNIWYRLQKSKEAAPSVPVNEAGMTTDKWTKATTVSFNLTKDHDNTDLAPKTAYTLYAVKLETGDTQISNLASKELELGMITQKGTLTMSGDEVIGKTITATLSGENNSKGTWKWYRSSADCGTNGETAAPSPTDTSKWVQLADGYSPTINSTTSTLNINETLWKYYIKAEFVANSDEGYGGDSIKKVSTTFIRKIYDETLELTSSTKDGNGDPTAYPNTVITGTIHDYAESGNLNTNRATVRFTVGSNSITSGFTYAVDTANQTATFKYTMPQNASYNGQNVKAEVTQPKNLKLFVDKELKALSGTTMNSQTSTGTFFTYKNGIPISNESDLKNFIMKQGSFSSRGNGLYILTNNIKYTGSALNNASTGAFNGTLDGDYHTITGLRNSLFYQISGATVKNIIFNDVDIDTSNGNNDNYSASIITRTQIGSATSTFDRLFLSQANIISGWDTGYLMGKLMAGTININECSSGGGKLMTSDSAGRYVSGFVGYTSSTVNISNSSSIMTNIAGKGSNVINGLVGGVGSNNVKNAVVASIITGSFSASSGGVGDKVNLINGYFDNTLSSNSNLAGANKGTAKATSELIGTKLQTAFNADSIWTYKEGYYPRLSWIKSHPISNLFAATRGAFTSVDNATSATNMFNGNIYGPIKVPVELQDKAYSISSSNSSILKVTDGGTIIPVGNVGQSAVITIKYTEPDSSIGGSASNTYTFTVQKKVNAFSSVSISGTTNPGQTLTANVSGATTFQWYRRKAGTTNAEAISGATGSTYTLKSSDAGYEFSVDVSASGYAKMSSAFTNTVTSVKPSGITTSGLSENEVSIMAQGVSGATYEYAYATSASGNKIMAGSSTNKITIDGLSRNKDYWLFARVAGAADGSYEPSPWSDAVKVTTLKTNIEGAVTVNDSDKAGMELTASVPDTNLQKGDWKVESVKNGVTTVRSGITSSDYRMSYTISDDDIGGVLKVTYTGKDGFQSSISANSNTILKRYQVAPSKAPEEVEADKSDHSLSIKHTEAESGVLYEFGYRKDAKDEMKSISGTYAANAKATVTGLDRNTFYLFYARKLGNASKEPSTWSPAVQVKTDRSSVKDDTIQISGTPKVNQTLTFTYKPKDTNTASAKGVWILERIGSGNSSTLIPASISADTKTITYGLVAEDAGFTIQATFIANGDYKNECSGMSAKIQNNSQDIGTVVPTISGVSEYETAVQVAASSSDIYEFGYQKNGASVPVVFPIQATWGKDVTITPLLRDSEYTIYVRKAAKLGYEASGWSSGVKTKTLKTKLTGNISYTGTTSVGDTIKVSYEAGEYPYVGDDTTGSWRWYLDDVAVTDAKGGNTDTLNIEPMDGNPVVKVVYTADKDSGFKDEITRTFGNVYKNAFKTPDAPNVSADGEDAQKEGSVLHLSSSDTDDVYYYLQLSSNEKLPKLELVKDVADAGAVKNDMNNVDRWLKASGVMDIRVPANRSYVVYAARLENDSHMASGYNAAKAVTSAREPLLRDPVGSGAIKDKDPTISWKTRQEKTLEYTLYGKAPSANWNYYVSKKSGADAQWQNIGNDLSSKTEEKKDGVYRTAFEIPLKYTGYYFKATLGGIDDYSSQVELVVPDALEGKVLKGTVSITDTAQYHLLDELTAQYQGDDVKSGSFYWYREKDGVEELIQKAEPGMKSTYQLQLADHHAHVYAVYKAAPEGRYSGEVKSEERTITEKAVQKKPEAPALVQVYGNSIQFKAPMDYHKAGMDKRPQTVIGYQKVTADGTALDAGITWQKASEYDTDWFRKLERRSYYRLYAKYLETDVYEASEVSDAGAPIQTGNALYEEAELSVQALASMDGTTNSDIGNKMRMTYSGEGYEEGYFGIRRSNGDTIVEKVVDPIVNTGSVTYDYTYTADDVGSYIIVDFVAKADAVHYEGSISKTNKLVITKPANPDTADEPQLEQDLDTNLLAAVDDSYEYVLNESSIAPLTASGEWDTIEKDKTGKHEFSGLDRTKTYYLHARIAETKEYRVGTAVSSAAQTPIPYVDFKTVDVKNTTDEKTPAMNYSESIAFPSTLKKGTITIEDFKIKKKDDDTKTIQLHGIDEFVKDGRPTAAVLEKGSVWGNENFAVELLFYDADGNIVDRTNGTNSSIDASSAVHMKAGLYRVNAVSDPGPYVWEMTLKDSSKEEVTSLLHGELTTTTQLQAMVPKEIHMNLDGQFIRQSTNNAGLRNTYLMPLTFSVDRKVEKGTGMPSLMGVFHGGIANIEAGKAYLKMSNDGSNFTSRRNGAWFQTEGSSEEEALYHLGGGSRAAYYVSGAAADEELWPWPIDGSEVILQAYKFRFVTSISEQDVALNERKSVNIQ